MNLKKILSVLLVAIMIFSMTACGSSDSESESSTEEVKEEIPTINVATGVITGQLNSAYASEEGDKLISSLVMPTIYTTDRSGRLLTDAAEGKTVSFNGTDYEYKNFADISSSYDKKQNISTFTIKLASDACFSDGSDMTSDDLIFTYYVLCDESYDGEYDLSDSNIIGIRAYQLNNTAAPNIEITDEQITAAFNNPSDELKSAFSTSIIRPVIEEGRKFCEENWEKYVDRGYGDSAQELFVMLFPMAIDSDYSADGKDFDQVVEDTVSLFGMNYKQLARIYYGDVEYLNDDADEFVEKYLYEQALEKAGGTEVPSITGITKVDENSISIRAVGTVSELQKELCNIPVLSLKYYGDSSSYNYDTYDFGVTRGDVTVVKSHSSDPFGYGPYTVYSSENNEVVLQPNTKYYAGNAPTENLKFIHIEEDSIVDAIEEGTVDLAVVDYNDEQIEAINKSKTDISTITFNDNQYEYFGFNMTSMTGVLTAKDTAKTKTMKAGALRNALGILITAAREDAIASTIGDGAKLIDYPGSSAYWGTPKSTDSKYSTAYSTNFDLSKQSSDYLAAAKAELVKAGYTYNKKTGKFVTNAKIKSTFSIAIPSYEIDNSAMIKVYETLEKYLKDLGFTLKATYYDTTDDFILALSAKKHDIWMAHRKTSSFSLKDYYGSDGKYNYYGFAKPNLDTIISKVVGNSEEAEAYSKSAYRFVMRWSIEVPVYQKQCAIIYNSKTVSIAGNLDFTEYFGLFDYPSAITKYDASKEQESTTEAIEETTIESAADATNATETTVAASSAADSTAQSSAASSATATTVATTENATETTVAGTTTAVTSAANKSTNATKAATKAAATTKASTTKKASN